MGLVVALRIFLVFEFLSVEVASEILPTFLRDLIKRTMWLLNQFHLSKTLQCTSYSGT